MSQSAQSGQPVPTQPVPTQPVPGKWEARMKAAFRTKSDHPELLSTAKESIGAKALELNAALAKDRNGRSQAVFEEARAQTILDGMEASTQSQQNEIAAAVKAVNDREQKTLEAFALTSRDALDKLKAQPDEQSRKKKALAEELAKLKAGFQAERDALPTALPLSHAVSAHGPGSDQVSRLVHGQRGDGPAAVGGDAVSLTGNTKGVPDATVAAATKVGSNPSNRAGAFNSAGGMLEVTREAFAQADMVSRYAEQPTTTSKDVADARLAVVVPGADPNLGYNVEVEGYMPQKKGVPLSKDEIVARFAAIKRTEGMRSAQMILDPAYVNVSKPGEEPQFERAGWNLQTAFASDRQADQPFGTPDQVGDSLPDLKARQKSGTELAKQLKQQLADAEEARGGTTRLLAVKQGELDKLTGTLATYPQGVDVAATFEAIRKKIAELDETIDGLTQGGFDPFADPPDPDDPPAPKVLSADEQQELDEADAEKATQSALSDQYEAWIKADARRGEVAPLTDEVSKLNVQKGEQDTAAVELGKKSAAANDELAKVNRLLKELPLADAKQKVEDIAAELADVARTQAALEAYPQGEKPKEKLAEAEQAVAKAKEEIGKREAAQGPQASTAEQELQGLREELAKQQKAVEQYKIWAEYQPWVESLIDAVGDAATTFEQLHDQLPKAVEALRKKQAAAEADLASLEKKMAEAAAADQSAEEDGDAEGEEGTLSVPGAYNPKTGKYEMDEETGGKSGSKRPEKPDDLKGKDVEGDALTAHHVYPWNQILPDFNKALESGSKSELEKLLAFGRVKVDADFWLEFAKKPAERSYNFADTINKAISKICWAQSNIFMGPSGSKRADDPGEKREKVFTDSGLEAPASVSARLAEKAGGLGQERMHKKPGAPKDMPKDAPEEHDELAERFEANLRTVDKARPYRESEWTEGADGKLTHRGKVEVSEQPALDKLVEEAAEAIKAFDELLGRKPLLKTAKAAEEPIPDADKPGPDVAKKPPPKRGDYPPDLTREALEAQKVILQAQASAVAADDAELGEILAGLTRRDKAFYDRELIDARTELGKRLQEIETVRGLLG